MKKWIKNWLFKEDVEEAEWYFARKRDELERSYQDRANYLQMKYSGIERENEYLKKALVKHASVFPAPQVILNETSDDK